MAKVKITCDRCGQEVEGILTSTMTAGFYNVAQPYSFDGRVVHEGGAWSKFGQDGEEYICDHCMWADPEYQEIYHADGEMRQWIKEQGD